MKKLASVIEVPDEGMIQLLGEKVLVTCMRYNYAGVLAGVNNDCILLENAVYVFDTGGFTSSTWNAYEKVPFDKIIIQKSAIENIHQVYK